MNSILIWLSFIILMSFSEELDLSHYLLFGSSMLYFTYVCNQISPIVISVRTSLLLFNIPAIILWYVAFVYNDFLSIDPISYESFVSFFLIYLYLILYIFFEYRHINRHINLTF